MNPKNTNVDTSKEFTHVGLCAGYGGIELGLKRVIPALRTVALCEIEAFACANLVSKMEAGLMDAAPIWSDLKTFPWAEFRGKVDILTGGYPCQPFSAAGKRAGKDDPRHLWPWIADGIRLLQPRCCFFENVEGHITLGLSTVISDLEELGYKVSWGIFSASEVGAPHQRKRVFILAVASGIRSTTGIPRSIQRNEGITRIPYYGRDQDIWPSRPGEPQHGWEPPRVVVNSKGKRTGERSEICVEERRSRDALSWESEQSDQIVGNAESRQDDGRGSGSMESQTGGWECGHDAADLAGELGDSKCAERRPDDNRITGEGEKGSSDASSPDRREAEPAMGRDADGPSDRMDYAKLYTTCDNRTDELRLLGNGVVPATAEKAFRTLFEALKLNDVKWT